MKIFILLSCFFILEAIAQGDQYQMTGSLGINTDTKKEITFTLKWNEENGKANGTYSDNLYADSAPAKGITGELGRIFVVTLPRESRGVRTISFLGPDLKSAKRPTLIPLSIVLRDRTGKPVNTTSIQANLSSMVDTKIAQRQEANKCQEGFGVLAGYCGVYSGMLSEEIDTKAKCNLLAIKETRLVMDENAEVGLTLGEMSAILSPPIHRIGRLFTDTDTTRVDLISRSCRPLPGTTFNGDDCKRINLIGNFSIKNKLKHFTGDYIIVDEKTNETCRYNLSMDQMI